MIKSFWRKIKKRFSHQAATDKNKWEPNPRRDWILILTFFLVGLLVSLGTFLFLYASLIGFNDHQNLPANLTSSEDNRNLNVVLTEFKTKAARFKSLELKPNLIDPSL